MKMTDVVALTDAANRCFGVAGLGFGSIAGLITVTV